MERVITLQFSHAHYLRYIFMSSLVCGCWILDALLPCFEAAAVGQMCTDV